MHMRGILFIPTLFTLVDMPKSPCLAISTCVPLSLYLESDMLNHVKRMRKCSAFPSHAYRQRILLNCQHSYDSQTTYFVGTDNLSLPLLSHFYLPVVGLSTYNAKRVAKEGRESWESSSHPITFVLLITTITIIKKHSLCNICPSMFSRQDHHLSMRCKVEKLQIKTERGSMNLSHKYMTTMINYELLHWQQYQDMMTSVPTTDNDLSRWLLHLCACPAPRIPYSDCYLQVKVFTPNSRLSNPPMKNSNAWSGIAHGCGWFLCLCVTGIADCVPKVVEQLNTQICFVFSWTCVTFYQSIFVSSKLHDRGDD